MTAAKRKEDLDAMKDKAPEAEVDPGRHAMEEAVLATVAVLGPDDPTSIDFSRAYAGGALTFRHDLNAIGRALWDTIFIDRLPVDPILIRDKLQSAGAKVNDEVLKGILDRSKAKDTAVAGEYIKKLITLDKFTAAEAAGREYLNAIEKMRQEDGDVAIAFADLSRKVFDLAREKKLIREHLEERYAADGFLDTLNARRADGRDWLGLDCGFKHLNEVLNGLPEGVIILAGAPSCGKTTLAKQIADHVAEVEKVPVLFYSYEQSAEELRIKSLARLSFVDSRKIWKGRSVDVEWNEVEKASEDYREGPGHYLTIIEAGRTDTVEAIRADALMKKHRAGDKPILLVLDYLQILPAGPSAPEALRERIDWNLSELRRLSRELKSPVLVVSSENRETYKGNKKPTMAALKESGGIEYSADVVICLWRDKKETDSMEQERVTNYPDRPKSVRVEAHVLKNRNGELAKVKLDFTPAWAVFHDEGKDALDYEDALGE